MIRVYICHPFAGDQEANKASVREFCRAVTESSEDHLPIAPQVYLSQWMDDGTDRDHAMRMCLELLDVCDELWLCGSRISSGMRDEVDHASRRQSYKFRCFETPADVRKYLKDSAETDPPF